MQSYAAIARSGSNPLPGPLAAPAPTHNVLLDVEGGRHGLQSQASLDVLNVLNQGEPQAPEVSAKLRLKTLRCRLNSPLAVLSSSPDKELVVVGGKDVLKVLNVKEAEIRETSNLRAGMRTALNYSLTDAKWAGKYAQHTIASAYLNGDIILWDLNRGNQKQSSVIKEHDQSVNRLSFHPDDPLLLSACQDATIKLWDLREKSHDSTTFEGRADKVRDVQFSPTSSFEFIAAFENGDVQKWDIRKPNEPERRWSAHFGLALTVDWHPDGNVFASAGRDKVIKFWDTKIEGRKPFQTIQTSSHVARIAWRPTSSTGVAAHQIASCSLAVDSKLSVWDLGRGFVAEWAVEEHDGPITDFLWQDSDILWTVSKDHTFVRQDLQVAGYHPYELLPPCAGAWNQFGDYTFSLPQQQQPPSPDLQAQDLKPSPPVIPEILQRVPSPPPPTATQSHRRSLTAKKSFPSNIAQNPSILGLQANPPLTGSLPSIHSTPSSPPITHSSVLPISPVASNIIKSPHAGPVQQLIAVYETGGFNDTSFVQLAFQYDLGKTLESRKKGSTMRKATCDEIWEMCRANSEAAAKLDLPRASQTWAFLQLLFGIEVPPEPEPRMFKKSTTGSGVDLLTITQQSQSQQHSRHPTNNTSTTNNSTSSTIHSPAQQHLPLPAGEYTSSTMATPLIGGLATPPPLYNSTGTTTPPTTSTAAPSLPPGQQTQQLHLLSKQQHAPPNFPQRSGGGNTGADSEDEYSDSDDDSDDEEDFRFNGLALKAAKRGLHAGVAGSGNGVGVPSLGAGGAGGGETASGPLQYSGAAWFKRGVVGVMPVDHRSPTGLGTASAGVTNVGGGVSVEERGGIEIRQHLGLSSDGYDDSDDTGSSIVSGSGSGGIGKEFLGIGGWGTTVGGDMATAVAGNLLQRHNRHHHQQQHQLDSTAVSAVTPIVTPTTTNNWVFEDLAVPQLDREDLALDILNFYGELGNAQMCASILLVLEGYLTRVDPAMKELWISSYVVLADSVRNRYRMPRSQDGSVSGVWL
ncbi:UNVERIFIED_CONTAM: WD repeat-containing protein 24 [Siphonaria sp. JEL0065]|nr:WD repeat-containing protein 24 [Siphonaria sp. JEL0065]